MTGQVVSALVGIWLMVAPAVLGYEGPAAVNDRIAGPLVATAGVIAVWEAMRIVRWFNVGAGLWLLLAPVVLGYGPIPLLNSLAAGMVLVAFAPDGGWVRGHFGGGWSSLWGMPGWEGYRAGGDHPRVVVITGASAGIGRATARAFADRGDHLGLLARGRAGLEAAKREVEELGGRAVAIEVDMADAEAVEQAAATIEERLGPIDVWISNAMLSVFSPVAEMTAADYRRVIDVTYLGYVHGALAALRRMRERNQGIIVHVGSALAYRGIPLQSAYCAAKHAVQGFADSLRAELLHDHLDIRLTAVHMPAVNTPQFRWVKSRLPNEAQPVPPIFQPEMAARAIVWATDHPRRELLVGWPSFKAVWGDKLFPGFGDRYLAKIGYSAQQIDTPLDTERPHNLWEPVDAERDHGVDGVFGARAKPSSAFLWLTMRLGLVVRSAAGVMAVVLVGWAAILALAG